MKTARWLTAIGSFVSFASGILHATGYTWLLRGIASQAIQPPLSGFLKSSWFAFAVELWFLAAIAFLARARNGGGSIVLVCALCAAVTAAVSFRFMGLFPGVYLLSTVAVFFVLGGWLQIKHAS